MSAEPKKCVGPVSGCGFVKAVSGCGFSKAVMCKIADWHPSHTRQHITRVLTVLYELEDSF